MQVMAHHELVRTETGLQKALRLIAFQAEFNQGLRSMNVKLVIPKINRNRGRDLCKKSARRNSI